jgi:uncharacterized membrane protein
MESKNIWKIVGITSLIAVVGAITYVVFQSNKYRRQKLDRNIQVINTRR